MSELVFTPDELTSENRDDFYKAIYLQLAKDFEPYWRFPTLLEPMGEETIVHSVRMALYDITSHQPSALGPILYRIDLGEKTTRRAMNESSLDQRITVLTELVIRREAQKVWLRKKWSNSEPDDLSLLGS